MVNGYENFDNTEMHLRKDSLIQERVGLVSSHMYKQFLEYQNATVNTSEIFNEIIVSLKPIVESLKKSFATRGITTQNIYYEYDAQKTVITITILWYTFSLTTRCNYEPQALYRGDSKPPMFSGRIMAIKGNYADVIKGAEDKNDCLGRLLDSEIASLYVPSDKMQSSIFKIRHLSNRELFLNSQDAAREFILKVIEIVCGGGVYHEEGARTGFNL